MRMDHRKAREFHKRIDFCFIDYAKVFDCVDHNKLWKILKEMGIPNRLTWLLKKSVCRSRSNSKNQTWNNELVQSWERRQHCILSPCLFNLYEKCIMWNAGLDEAQAGIKITERNINNFRYADDTTLMEESEEDLRASWKWKRRVKKLA